MSQGSGIVAIEAYHGLQQPDLEAALVLPDPPATITSPNWHPWFATEACYD